MTRSLLGPAALACVLAGLWSWRGLPQHPGASRPRQGAFAAEPPASEPGPLPARLSETGLYRAGYPGQVAPDALPYVPQYPLWTDGARKRRWLLLPQGATIDGSKPDQWRFPAGTRFFKEFRFDKKVETRMIEVLAGGNVRYASYIWNEQQQEAALAPASGAPTKQRLSATVVHEVPSEADCRACHEGRQSAILGFGALQLSPARDPLAPHAEATPAGAVDLRELLARDLLTGYPARPTARVPTISAPTPLARAAAGYLFGNCAGCHNGEGPLADLGLNFDQSVVDTDSYRRMVGAAQAEAVFFKLPGEQRSARALAGDPERSVIPFRVGSRSPSSQMPPLGTKLVDLEGVQLITHWISSELQ